MLKEGFLFRRRRRTFVLGCGLGFRNAESETNARLSHDAKDAGGSFACERCSAARRQGYRKSLDSEPEGRPQRLREAVTKFL